LRTIISGFVSSEWTACIICERVIGLRALRLLATLFLALDFFEPLSTIVFPITLKKINLIAE
jgi:hypothetical protein